jgi:hypothetical protein
MNSEAPHYVIFIEVLLEKLEFTVPNLNIVCHKHIRCLACKGQIYYTCMKTVMPIENETTEMTCDPSFLVVDLN